jgi:glutamate-1-semialdehyde 2,1-aminomutase
MDFLSPQRVGNEVVMYSGTFSGNPVSCAAAIATIGILKRPGTYERLHRVGTDLAGGLRAVSQSLGISTFVQSEGPTVQIWFTDRDVISFPDLWAADTQQERRFKLGLMKRGVWSPPGQKFFLSLAHSDDDLNFVLNAAEQAMGDLRH